jgi:DNA-binding response OmpR family regulator
MIDTSHHVLSVEDAADIADGIRYWLKREGMRVSIAATGEQGLGVALDGENPPALILLDLMLPA